MRYRFASILFALLLSAGVATAQTSAPATTQSALPPQPADIPAPKLDKNGKPNERFISMHEQFLKRAAEGHIDLLFLGDSITEGWSKAGADIWKMRYEKQHPANFGISGDRTQHVLWRITNGELDSIHPKVLVLMIGTNNGNYDPAEQIISGIEKIVRLSREKTGAKILLLGIFPRGRSDAKNEVHHQRQKLQSINAAIAKLDDGKSIRYLDLWDKFLESDGHLSKEVMPDALHPSAKGYQIWADGMDALLTEMMK